MFPPPGVYSGEGLAGRASYYHINFLGNFPGINSLYIPYNDFCLRKIYGVCLGLWPKAFNCRNYPESRKFKSKRKSPSSCKKIYNGGIQLFTTFSQASRTSLALLKIFLAASSKAFSGVTFPSVTTLNLGFLAIVIGCSIV
ncbi:140aa long hypothetical protein [Pyrococcus horikoshii OT3]|uniref:Uncharacterized protein n=1 Tax=Pyrococcus horikoshii (strain ATCC 700860 / DSM 12428 / JCM 9974 / NBRC 100139 / OT-3) TaxID=70601 RepID=O74078_PYRHO|nr:140aa long hypothetical protein [Pyrococcus horikoshii OT3]